MPLCELCGKEAPLVLAEIEGGELKVCSSCASYGKVKRRLEEVRTPFKHHPLKPVEPEFKIVDNYAELLRTAREKKGLNQEDFAKLLQERVSTVAKWEQGTLQPSLETAKKIGRILNRTLIEKDERSAVEIKKGKSDEFTLGDFVKVRKRN